MLRIIAVYENSTDTVLVGKRCCRCAEGFPLGPHAYALETEDGEVRYAHEACLELVLQA